MNSRFVINKKLVPDCRHCELDFVKNKSKSLVSLANLGENTKGFGDGASTDVTNTVKDSRVNGPIIGRLVHAQNGCIFLLHYYFNNSIVEGYDNSLYLLILCEISGKFNSSDLLKCSKTEHVFISCWLIIRDWSLVRVNTHDSSAPIRSKLLKLHFDPSCILLDEKSENKVKFLKNSIFCFEACSVIWISHERTQRNVYSATSPSRIDQMPKLHQSCVDVVGAVIHISEIVKHKLERGQYGEYKKKLKAEVKTEENYEVDVYFESIMGRSKFGSSFSAVIRPINTQKNLVIFFPDSSHLVIRYILGWENIYKFENLFPGSVLIHSPLREPREKKCLIAVDATSVRIQECDSLDYIHSNNIYGNEYPVFVQIDKVLGFGIFELNTKNKPVRLFLHNSGFHQAYIGSSLTRGSVLWLRNPRKINIESSNGTSIFVGISIESYSDWGIQNHSKFVDSDEKNGETIWRNQPLHLQTIGYEFLEFSECYSNFNPNNNFFHRVKNCWDIRNYCYYHFSLYVDIFNITGIPKDITEGISILLVQILSLNRNVSPIVILKDKLDIVFVLEGKVIGCSKSILPCSRSNIEVETRITHPTQTVDIKSGESPSILIKCCNTNNGFWRLVPIEDWFKLLEGLNTDNILYSISTVTSREVLSFERLFSVIGACGNETSDTVNIARYSSFSSDILGEFFQSGISSSMCILSATKYSQDYIGLCGHFLVEAVMNEYMESNYWISNIFFIKTPKFQTLRKGIYILFIESKNSSNLRIYQEITCEKKLLFIKKAYIRLLGDKNKNIALFASESDIVLTCIQNSTPSILNLSGPININQGLLLYIRRKKTIMSKNRSKIEFYFQCIPFFTTRKQFKRGNSLDLSLLVEIRVSSDWYFKINSSRFVIVTKNPVIENQRVTLDEETEKEFIQISGRCKDDLFFIKELNYPFVSDEYIVSGTTKRQSNIPGVEIIFSWLPDEFLFWPFYSEQSLFIKYDEHIRTCRNDNSFELSVFELKFWIEDMVEWILFKSENPLVYGSISCVRSELRCIRERKNLFVGSCLGGNNDVERKTISLKKARIVDIIRFTGFNPELIHGNWTILKVTNMETTWNSGWIDLWLSDIDIKSKSIDLVAPGEIVSISNISIVNTKQKTPSYSPASYILCSIISSTVNDFRQDKSIYYDQCHTNESCLSVEMSESAFSKCVTNSSFKGGTPKTRGGKVLSIFNNGAIVFRTAIKNSRIDLNTLKKTLKHELFNCLFFSISQFSEMNLLSGLGYEHGEKNILNKIPNPYVLAPDGSPLTRGFIINGGNNKDASKLFNRLYCIENGYENREFNLPVEYLEFLSDCNRNIDVVDPDETIVMCGSVIHIEQIEMGWFCLKCLRLLNSLTICSCGVDHKSISNWTSLSVYLVGTLEIILNCSKSKLFPFVMTNWNALKFLVYSGVRCKIGTNSSDIFNNIIKLANMMWNYMESLRNKIGTCTLYMHGETCGILNSSSSSGFHSASYNTIYDGEMKHSDENAIPVGVIGDNLILDNDKNIIAAIPNDPVGNVEFEACIRFININEVTEANKNMPSLNAYIHIVRWRLRDNIKELKNGIIMMNL